MTFALAGAATALLTLVACNGPMYTDATPDPRHAGRADTLHEPATASAFTGFALRLFQQVRQEEGERNIFLSPTSVAFALAMTHHGAAGETREAIARTLGASSQELHRASAALRQAVLRDDEDVQLRLANSLWARTGVPFRPEFLQGTREAFAAEVATLDFADPAAAQRINDWVSRHTEDRIPSIVERLDPQEVLFLVNAVYFKGRWTLPFEARATQPGSFTLPSGEQISHPMMSRTGQFRVANGTGWQGVRLPYGEDERLAMYIFLPAQGRSLADLSAQLDADRWEPWMQSFQEQRLHLTMPRFRLEYSLPLRPALEAMGMQLAFDPARADFGGMLPRDYLDRNNAYVTRVQHKTFVEVNEEGTEATGATTVGIGIVSMPPQFSVDRPFFVAIRDEASGEILFAGQVVDPR